MWYATHRAVLSNKHLSWDLMSFHFAPYLRFNLAFSTSFIKRVLTCKICKNVVIPSRWWSSFSLERDMLDKCWGPSEYQLITCHLSSSGHVPRVILYPGHVGIFIRVNHNWNFSTSLVTFIEAVTILKAINLRFNLNFNFKQGFLQLLELFSDSPYTM